MKKINSLESDFFIYYKLAQAQGDTAAWHAALDKINSVPQNSTLAGIVDKLAVASTGIVPMLEAIKESGMGANQLKSLMSLAGKLGAITAGKIDTHKMEKFSSAYMKANNKGKEKLLKQAGILDTVSETASSLGESTGLGDLASSVTQGIGGMYGTITKLLPYASTIYSGITAVTSLLSAFKSYQDLVAEASELDLKWYETLMPWKLSEKFADETIKNDPGKLGSLGYICAIGSKFIEDGLVGLIRAVVASKGAFDIVMEVLNGEETAATGLLGNLKPFLPLLQLLIEWGAGKLLSYGHKSLLAKILDVINSHIDMVDSPAPAPTPERSLATT